jgi:2-iminobutanoate/2-iminopropanoate deaminase
MKTLSLTAAVCLAVGFAVGGVFSQERVDVASLPFSAARPAGDTLFVSGQIAVRPDGSPVTGDIAEQTRQVMANIGEALAEHGYGFEDVVNVTVYLSDMEHYAGMNAAYREFFPNGHFPARATVGGLQIAFGLDVEISAVAHK